MTVLAVMATGAHVLAITSPALAEQAQQTRVAAAETERSIVADPPTAASDGLPVPALAGGIVVAFAVGLGAGHVHRRRRRTAQPRQSRASRRAAAHAPPARPAPPPPEPAPPAPPVVIAPPAPPVAPVPPPPEPRPAEPHVVVPPPTPAPAPAPPEPPGVPEPPEVPEPAAPRRRPEPYELFDPFGPFEPEPWPLPDTRAPLAERPEVPRSQRVEPAPGDEVAPPLGQAPEALRALQPSRPAPEPEPEPAPDAPAPIAARRFARLVPWPEEAEALWTCEIDWKPGYRKSSFRALAEPPGAGKRRQIGESPPLRWALMTDPEPPTPEYVALARALIAALEAAGWERIGRGGPWYAQRFLWRGEDEPGPVAVPSAAETQSG